MDRSQHTIVVVDDHEPSRYAAVKMLRSLGYNTSEAENGEQALMVANDDVSAVLLDVNLPDVNGVKVCEHLKSERRQLAVVLMSAVYTDDLHKGAAMDAGADGYLISPFGAEQLGAMFDGLLEARSGR
jgi:CheY-like chemotaxis protein